MHLSAEAVSELLLCEVESDVESVSKRHDVTFDNARGAWVQWSRRIRGNCPGCGRKVDGSICRECKGKDIDTRDLSEVLERISGNKVLIRCTCLECHNEIEVTADFILSTVQRHGKFLPPKLCRNCRWPNKPLTFRPFQELKRLKPGK